MRPYARIVFVSASCKTATSLVNGAVGGRAALTLSLNARANSSSLGWLASAKAAAAAITRSRFGCMLPLLSMSRPTVTGASSLVNSSSVLRPAVFENREGVARQPRDVRPASILDRRVDHDEIGFGGKHRPVLPNHHRRRQAHQQRPD